MKKVVVLYSLDQTNYLADSNAKSASIITVKDWKKAIQFSSEDAALSKLKILSKKLVGASLNNWCTRTFYKLQ